MNPAIRVRSNSYNSHPAQSSELGPLARIPSPDPDHIDGLHRHASHSSNAPAGGTPLPTKSYISNNPVEKERSMFTLSNSSAPALSTIPTTPPTLTHRSATTPAKRLVFANNLSVYDTFSSAVYDRRSEPATWSRLTPALAQRIKEELNSYKMEEMEVHACSRMQYVLHLFEWFCTNPSLQYPIFYLSGLLLVPVLARFDFWLAFIFYLLFFFLSDASPTFLFLAQPLLSP